MAGFQSRSLKSTSSVPPHTLRILLGVTPELLFVAAALALVAALYSSVGHGGASGYLAVLAIAGFAPEELRPTALVLNVIVASTAAWRFRSHFRGSLFWPFAVASVPCAFLAGRWIHLDAGGYHVLLGLVLLYAAWRLIAGHKRSSEAEKPPVIPIALASGAAIGLISGMIGVGGGIFLSPLLILAGWANPRATAAVSSVFILANSAAALIGLALHHQGVPIESHRLGIYAGFVLAGGVLGSTLGANRLDQTVLKRLLAIVVLVAAVKMIVSAIG